MRNPARPSRLALAASPCRRGWRLALLATICLVAPGGGAWPPVTSGQPKAVEITVGKNAFTPREVVVRVGQAVVWCQPGEGRHAVQAADGSFRSPILGTGGSFTHTPAKPGRLAFYCRFHGEPDGSEMGGVLDVRPAD